MKNKRNLYSGLPIIESGSNRGGTNHEAAAELLGLEEAEYKKALMIVKAMYDREPESTITLIEFIDKLKEQKLNVSDLGTGIGLFQAGRINDEGPYTNESFSFISMRENLDQRNENNPTNLAVAQKVHTPYGIFESAIAAALTAGVNVKTIHNRISSSDIKFKDYYYLDKIYEKINLRMKNDNKKFFSNDNISEYFEQYPKDQILDAAEIRAREFMRSLMIDIDNDPNAKGTGRRLAKMMLNELFVGRYEPTPPATAFPNTGKKAYHGMLTVRAELKSVCSHHWQTVTADAWIGIIPAEEVIGLSKYVRLAQHQARRGTLQEELTIDIANAIQRDTESEDVAVHIIGRHGCMENRGICAHNSNTSTTILRGAFRNADVKKEFFDSIKLQNMRCD